MDGVFNYTAARGYNYILICNYKQRKTETLCLHVGEGTHVIHLLASEMDSFYHFSNFVCLFLAK